MDFKQLITYFNNLWINSISPTVKESWRRNEERSDKIVQAIKEKKNATDISVNNPDDISVPIIEAQNRTIQAIKDIPKVEVPQTDLKPLETQIEAINGILQSIEKKEMTVNVGKTKIDVDTKSIVKKLDSLEKSLLSMEKEEMQDYSDVLQSIYDVLSQPKDHSKMEELKASVTKLAKTDDMVAIAEWLEAIYKKEEIIYPFEFDKDGKLLVHVDRVGGGGGGGLTQIETNALVNLESKVATEATLQSVAGFNIPKYDTIEATYPTTSTEVYTYKYQTNTVGTITVTYSDATKAELTSVVLS